MSDPVYVWELLVDYDGTTRSSYASEGLFSTQQKAIDMDANIKETERVLGGSRIEKRRVR